MAWWHWWHQHLRLIPIAATCSCSAPSVLIDFAAFIGWIRHDPGDEVLEAGKFIWSPIRDGAMQMTREEFSLLLAGIDWTRVKRNTVKRPSKVG